MVFGVNMILIENEWGNAKKKLFFLICQKKKKKSSKNLKIFTQKQKPGTRSQMQCRKDMLNHMYTHVTATKSIFIEIGK